MADTMAADWSWWEAHVDVEDAGPRLGLARLVAEVVQTDRNMSRRARGGTR